MKGKVSIKSIYTSLCSVMQNKIVGMALYILPSLYVIPTFFAYFLVCCSNFFMHFLCAFLVINSFGVLSHSRTV